MGIYPRSANSRPQPPTGHSQPGTAFLDNTISFKMSRRRFSAAPDNTEIDTSPKLPPQPTMMPPTYHIDDLAEPMKHITRPLEKMAMCNPPNDSNTDDDGKPQDVPQAISKVASRVTGTEDALAELVRVAFIHTNMLKNLQTANAALSEQLKSTTMRLNQMEVEFRALRDAKAIDFMPKHLVNVNEAIINGRLVDDHHHNFHNPFTRNTGPKTECFQWTDMSSLAATLAVAPQVPGSASSAFSRSSNSDYRERRPFKPHRSDLVSSQHTILTG